MKPTTKAIGTAFATLAFTLGGPVSEASAGVTGDYTGSGIAIRSCASTSCTRLGLGYPGQGVCAHNLQNGWFYHTNSTTGVTGWSHGSYITVTSTTC